MATTQIDERAQAREVKTQTDAAIARALAQDWGKAVEANRAVLQIVPTNIEALNRLAKALLELGDFDEARGVVDTALSVDPANTIARRHRDRLEQAADTPKPTASPSRQAKRSRQSRRANGVKEADAMYGSQATADSGSSTRNVFSSHLLMSEAGKSTVATLIDATDRTAVGHLSSGEALTLRQEGNRLLIHSSRGEPVGRVHPRLAQRILSLMDAGNRYEAAFLRDHPTEGVQVIIGEVYQDPSQEGRPSFPPSGASDFRGYVRSNHELVDSGLGGPPARDISDDEAEPPQFDALVRAHDRGELGQARGVAADGMG